MCRSSESATPRACSWFKRKISRCYRECRMGCWLKRFKANCKGLTSSQDDSMLMSHPQWPPGHGRLTGTLGKAVYIYCAAIWTRTLERQRQGRRWKGRPGCQDTNEMAHSPPHLNIGGRKACSKWGPQIKDKTILTNKNLLKTLGGKPNCKSLSYST